MPEISIQSVRKTYGTHVAIDAIDLKIPDGAFCVFLGPSGCGKSTTLNCIAGLERVTSGKIMLGAHDVTDLAPHERNIAMVFQSSLLYPHLTAMENIRMSLRGAKSGTASLEKQIESTVNMLDIRKILNKKPSMMSGGERQRVAMAKAVVRNPAAFLMDEPLAALDAALRQSLRSDLVHLQKQLGVTTVFVTHDQVEAMTMGDIIVVMNNGRIEQVGTPQDIYSKPKTRFVAGFLGSPPMNFLKGTLNHVKDEPFIDILGTRFALPRSISWPNGNREIEIGLRPQNLALLSEAQAGALPATVYSLEYLGKENVVVLQDELKNTIRVLTEPTIMPRIGEKVFVLPDIQKLHYFD